MSKNILYIWWPCRGMQFYHHEFSKKLMERAEERIEVDETNLGFCLFRILLKVSPCGYAKVMGA